MGAWKDEPRLTIDPLTISPDEGSLNSNGFYLIDMAKGKVDISAEVTNHRHGLQCAFVIIDLQFIPEDPGVLSEELIWSLTRTYGTVTRKDQDHYALITTKTFLATVLQLEFTRQLKFKLVLYGDGTDLGTNVAAMSVCFYCDAGKPELQNVLPAIKTFLRATADGLNASPITYQNILFQDYTQRMPMAMNSK